MVFGTTPGAKADDHLLPITQDLDSDVVVSAQQLGVLGLGVCVSLRPGQAVNSEPALGQFPPEDVSYRRKLAVVFCPGLHLQLPASVSV